ncbi:hypothetical protein VTN77DRAFT_4481 [Rasamsonia byssochlamydoides]|uniref:uncharacterized protein n=1 Tax=Rasamsonia byssochlamydoides TaxID=89139 RepID=UPI0037439116
MYNSNTDIWIAGAVAAFTVDFVVYPLDTLKTRIQSPHYAKLYTNLATGRVNRALLFRGLYQGIWSVVLATIPSSGAFFTTYEGIKYALNSASSSSPNPENNLLPFTHSLPTPVVHAIASSAAESVSCFILTPAEVLKQNAQMLTSRTPGMRGHNATLQVLAKFRHHPTRLWRGYTALVARNLPFTGLQFPLFEHLRSRIVDWRKKRKAGVDFAGNQQTETADIFERAGITAISAGLAGSVAAVVTTPIDVVKTRIMLAAGGSGSDQSSPTAPRRRPGALAVGRDIYLQEGIKGLFRGGALRAGWTALGLGLYLSAYESGRLYLENRRKSQTQSQGQGSPGFKSKSEEGEVVI